MLARQRFRLYRRIMARTNAKSFRDQQVFPLEVPRDEQIDVERLAPEMPRLYGARNFPATEHAKGRMRRIRLSERALPLIARLPAAQTEPIATDLEGLLDQIYPRPYREVWPDAPVVPPELQVGDVLAALAVSGPFALYLQRASTLADAEATTGGNAGPHDYVIDMSWFDAYPPKPGLLAPGGVAVFAADGDQLRTRGIFYSGKFVTTDHESFGLSQRLLLCALNTHLTTLLHNVTFHLGYVTPMAVATINELRPDHPIRRLLHPAFHTTLIGNYEVAKFQIVGKGSFATRLFSHDYQTLTKMIDDHLSNFRVADLDPDVAFARRGLGRAPFALPHWEDAMALWNINRRYAERYVEHYYADDAAVAADAELGKWTAALDELLPSGLHDDHEYLTAGQPIGRAMLARICATFLHTSSATHDVVNNAVWDYSTLNYAIPTVVPESLQPQDVRLSFDFLTTLIGTWKPYNMLVDGVSVLALDDQGRQIMDEYVAALRQRQQEMETQPYRAGRIYPSALNPSVSN